MGLDITVLALDRERLERTPAAERQDALYEAACPDIDWDAQPETGWVRPASPEVPWADRYEFHSTLGSHKPHFWAGDSWDDVRQFADPALARALDAFLARLGVWDDGTDEDDDAADPGLFPGDPAPWRPKLLLVCPPATVSEPAAHWSEAEPLPDGLREEHDTHAAAPGRWIGNFDEFAVLLREWAVVVRAAEQRGWELLGLPI
ncbi:hypothetical protein [Streptomyces sp. NPDC001250]|uniref:hypothetical protein n=1 Tax=Streptomyces sp. NPDC001250 TaxID=3154382 RepID=UPI00331935DA